MTKTAMGALKYLNMYLNTAAVCKVRVHIFDSKIGGKMVITVKYNIISCGVFCLFVYIFYFIFFMKVCSPVER